MTPAAVSGPTLDQTPVNLADLSGRERALWMDGFVWGRAGGMADGWHEGYAACDAEIASLQREAARIVHHLAGIPARDREADRQRAERRQARWSA